MALRVMIVEDEFLLAMDMEAMLQDAGYEVVGTAACMHSAEKLAANGKADIAIMDVNLARGTNGVETARLLRQKFNIRSLFVSGNLDEKTRAVALQWEPLGFVGKPFSPTEMLRALSSAVVH